jgi:putative restriction endonuclease
VLTPDELLSRIQGLRQARIKDQRAPHKPLLLLYLLGQLDSTGSSAVSYREAEPQVSGLIAEFGPPATSRHRAAMPFFHLDRSLWRLSQQATRAQHGHLLSVDAQGALDSGVENLLRADPVLRNTVVQRLLESNFPESYFDSICAAVGLPRPQFPSSSQPERGQVPRRRDPRFREAVFIAYGYACAMCGYDGRLGRDPVGLEAAHVQWWAFEGPDEVCNSLALCELHHKLFDRGALGLGPDHEIRVSPAFSANSDVTKRLIDGLVGQSVRPPRNAAHAVAAEYVEWHKSQVFRAKSL